MPRFGANCSIDPARPEWIHVETKALPPCCVPSGVPLDGQCRVVLGESPNLLKAALKVGIKLTVPEIDDVIRQLDVKLPAAGSGKSGNLLKADKARALVEFVFKDSVPAETPESIERMISQLCGAKIVETDDLLMEAVAAIDPEEAREFKHVINDCLNQVAAKRKKSATVAKGDVIAGLAEVPAEALVAPIESGGGNKWASHTPEALRCLLPGKNTLPYVYLRRNPSNDPGRDAGSYTGTYKRKLALIIATVN